MHTDSLTMLTISAKTALQIQKINKLLPESDLFLYNYRTEMTSRKFIWL